VSANLSRSAINPFNDLFAFAVTIRDETFARHGHTSSERCPLPRFEVYVREREITLQQILDAALVAAERTGFTINEVSRRINALADPVRCLLVWERDGFRTSESERDCSNPPPGGTYIAQHAHALEIALPPVRELAVRAENTMCANASSSDETMPGTPPPSLATRVQRLRAEYSSVRDLAERLHAIGEKGDWQGMVDKLWRQWRWHFSDGPFAPHRPTVHNGLQVADAADSLLRELESLCPATENDSKQAEASGGRQQSTIPVEKSGTMLSDFSDLFEQERERQREHNELENRRQEHLVVLRRVLVPFNALRSTFQEYYRLRQRPDASPEELNQMHSRLADACIALARCLKAEGWEDRFDILPPSHHRNHQIADHVYDLARQEQREALLSLFRELQTITPNTREDIWRFIVQNADELISPVETTFGGVPIWSNRRMHASGDPAEIRQPAEVVSAGEQITPAAQAEAKQAEGVSATSEEAAAVQSQEGGAIGTMPPFRPEQLPALRDAVTILRGA
jgi:hypothetical protein